MNLSHWPLLARKNEMRRSGDRLLNKGWHGCCVVGFSTEEATAIRKHARGAQRGRVQVAHIIEDSERCPYIGVHKDSSFALYFEHADDYIATSQFISLFPKRTNIIRVSPKQGSKIATLLKDAHPRFVEGSLDGNNCLWVGYREEELSEEDRVILKLTA